MLIALFARRLTVGVVASVAARTARTASLSLVARRTLFATPQFYSPPVKASRGSAKKPSSKSVEKKAAKGKGAAPAKKGKPPKDSKSKMPAKEEKQKVRVPASLKPPKRAPGPYFLFYSSFLKSQPRANTVEDCRALAKRAGEIWRAYSMAEKQSFYDENEGRKAQAKRERDEFFSKKSVSELKQLNAIRQAQGKSKVHTTMKRTMPISPFISFSNEFRSSPEGQVVVNETSLEKNHTVRTAIAAGERWRSMSKEEKAPYFERFEQAKQELKAGAGQTQS